MKKGLGLLLCLALLISLSACGGQPKETEPAQTNPLTEATEPTTTGGADDPGSTAGSEPTDKEKMVELVRDYIDMPIADLYAVIGEPISSDYASSCIGDGDDGMLFYDGFVVYTYREGDKETVYDVE